MSNDNRRPMSPIGSALFDMLNDMGKSQARIYSAKGCNPESIAEVQAEVDRLQRLHQSKVISAIRRQGDV